MRLKLKIKLITLLVSFLMIGAAAISSTVAFLYTYDDPVVNKFIPSKVTTAVVEDITKVQGVKSDVKIANTGDTTAWIRAAVVVTWQKITVDSATGTETVQVYGQMPELNKDYEITFNLAEQTDPKGKWEKADDGFYYWSQPVPVDKSTGILITSCKPKDPAPEGYFLTVEILGSGIQTFPDAKSYSQAWAKVVTTP